MSNGAAKKLKASSEEGGVPVQQNSDSEEVDSSYIINADDSGTGGEDENETAVSDRVPVTERRTPRGLRVAVVPGDYPDVKMTEEQAEVVEAALLESMCPTDRGASIQFSERRYENGALVLTCVNMKTHRWLRLTAQKMVPWPGARLEARQAKATLTGSQLVMWVNDTMGVAKRSYEQILELIQKQNRGVSTAEWKVMRGVAETDGNERLVLWVENRSFEDLKARNFKLFLGLSQVKFLKMSEYKKLVSARPPHQNPPQPATGSQLVVWVNHEIGVAKRSYDQILELIQKQNRGVFTAKWRVVRGVAVGDRNERLELWVDNRSFEDLKARNFKLFLGLSQVKFLKMSEYKKLPQSPPPATNKWRHPSASQLPSLSPASVSRPVYGYRRPGLSPQNPRSHSGRFEPRDLPQSRKLASVDTHLRAAQFTGVVASAERMYTNRDRFERRDLPQSRKLASVDTHLRAAQFTGVVASAERMYTNRDRFERRDLPQSRELASVDTHLRGAQFTGVVASGERMSTNRDRFERRDLPQSRELASVDTHLRGAQFTGVVASGERMYTNRDRFERRDWPQSRELASVDTHLRGAQLTGVVASGERMYTNRESSFPDSQRLRTRGFSAAERSRSREASYNRREPRYVQERGYSALYRR